jgi:two-component system, chemotaxis family, sensor kinase CheA
MSTSTRPDASAFTRQFVDEARDRLRSLGALMLRLEEQPASAEIIADIFREAHSLKGSAQMLGFVDVSQIAHQLEDLFVAAKRDAQLIDARAFDLVFRTLDVITVRVEELAQGGRSADAESDLQHARSAEGSAPPAADLPRVRKRGAARSPQGSLRVSIEKLESLAHLAPEMVLHRLKGSERHAELRRVEASLSRLRERIREDRLSPRTRSRSSELGDYADALDVINRRMRSLLMNVGDDQARLSLITEELRQHVIELTMLPVATVFDAFPRAVRDLARSFGKQVELTLIGSDTALDKRVIEQLSDPLIHLVRNAIDHGLESPAERKQAGKPAAGTLAISAEQHGDRIQIAVRDDGRGIDPVVLGQAAVRKGIVGAADLGLWNHDRLLNLIFEPGFSTRTETTDVSGRGVGMDVVRVIANRLGGSVSVTSEPGRGTKVLLDLPLSLALTRAVLVSVNGELLAIPTSPIRRILGVPSRAAAQRPFATVIEVDGETIPLAPLAGVLALPGVGATEQSALIIEARGSRVAISVDAVLEEQELVFQQLRGPLQDQATLSGAAILGNGEIVPILDVQAIVDRAIHGLDPVPAAISSFAPAVTTSGRILVVEDSLVAGELLTGILCGAGYEAAVTHHGIEALEVLRRDDWDLVISDVDMPEMDGFAFTEQVRGDPRLHDMPVIIVTSRDSEDDRQRGVAAGADAYVTKGSFDHHQLLDMVHRLMTQGRDDSRGARDHA